MENWIPAIFDLVKWLSIGTIVGILTGTSSAALLAGLEWATEWREAYSWLLLLLPVGGLLSGLIYEYLGKNVKAGNNLLLEQIHHPQQVIPWQMAPLVFVGTFIAHLFGASVGREGTAVQMGVAIVDSLSERLCQRLTPLLRLTNSDRRIVLIAGISGSFAAVFGTPLAGMVFGLEVPAVGKFRHDRIFPCLMAAIVGDRVTRIWGLDHQVYRVPIVPPLTIWGILTAIVAGIAFGLTARLFATLSHQIGDYFKAKISYPPLRPLIGGGLVAVGIQLVGTTKYIGLGIPTIVSAFDAQVMPWDFLAKIGFTTLSIGSGFKGGEVTPLFYIGATLGNALSAILPLPAPLLAGMGFVGVFAGAANTPLAGTLIAIELFGVSVATYTGIACVVSYLCSGSTGIYRAQRAEQEKV